MDQARNLTDLTVILPIAVSCVTVLGAVVSVVYFIARNKFKTDHLEAERQRDAEIQRERDALEAAAHEEKLKVIHAKFDAENTRLRIELERLRAENQQQEERSRKRDEALSEKIAALNIAVVAIQTEMKIRNGNGEGGGE